MNNITPTPRRIIRPKEACRRGGFSYATFWRRVKNDPSFPKVFPIGQGGRAVGQFEQEFDDWLARCGRLGNQDG